MTNISEYVGKVADKISDLLDKAEEEEDISTLSKIFDEIGTEADQVAEKLGKVTDVLNGKSQEMSPALQGQKESEPKEDENPDDNPNPELGSETEKESAETKPKRQTRRSQK